MSENRLTMFCASERSDQGVERRTALQPTDARSASEAARAAHRVVDVVCASSVMIRSMPNAPQRFERESVACEGLQTFMQIWVPASVSLVRADGFKAPDRNSCLRV